jgi:DNA repair photolyase
MYSIKGRGSLSNRESRYSDTRVVAPEHNDWAPGVDDNGNESLEPASVVTETRRETAKSIIASNRSPDIPFDQSINPYRGCEHGCIYCYARPTHAWLDLSPGLDFETRLSYKHNAAEQLEAELRAPGYRCKSITLGANTDPYQPIEKQYRITRQLLQVLQRFRHPVAIITKSHLVSRDIDILAEMAADNLCSVAISVTTLDHDLKRAMEPRTPTAAMRLQTMERLASAGIPVNLLLAPVIPALNDHEIETIVEQAASAGAASASYILLRLPLEIRELFHEWLQQHYPLRAEHVISLIRQARGGKDYDTRFGHRMRGTGAFADLIARRFALACERHGLACGREDYQASLDPGKFSLPPKTGDQFNLF